MNFANSYKYHSIKIAHWLYSAPIIATRNGPHDLVSAVCTVHAVQEIQSAKRHA